MAADGQHGHIRVDFVLVDHVSDVAEGAHAFLLTYGPHIRSAWVLLTRSAFRDYHNPFAVVSELHSHGCGEPAHWSRGVWGLGYWARDIYLPF